ncbi:MAG: hypothetical protein K2X34_05660 [Hyphomonadaceae bacterium]|nr:hypothetical protein [Hyphomonadaceae bacterium]
MRILLAFAAILLAHFAAPEASAQPIVTRDPRAYMETLADAMGVSGMAPLRSLYVELSNNAPLSTTVEASLLAYERGIPTTRAFVAKIEEDLTLSDTYRQIYLYHYWGQNYWLHTRVDFVRISNDGEWAISYVGFASEWSTLASGVTPGFRPSAPNR